MESIDLVGNLALALLEKRKQMVLMVERGYIGRQYTCGFFLPFDALPSRL
jgi:hypothetical protein